MAERLGIDAEKVEYVINGLSRGMEDLGALITKVSDTSKSIEQYWTSDASASFDNATQDFVSKANEIIPVLESLRGWVQDTANEYASFDAHASSTFSSFINA